MSDTHDEKDEITRIHYNKILGMALANTLLSTMPMGGLLIEMTRSLDLLQKSKALKKSKPTDTENLIEIIKSGKEQGVSEMKVEVDKSTAAGLNVGLIKKGVDANGTIGVKTQNRTVLEIKYK